MACLKVGDECTASAEYDKLMALNSGMAGDLMREIERKNRPVPQHSVKASGKK
jgi:hypothetical protein